MKKSTLLLLGIILTSLLFGCGSTAVNRTENEISTELPSPSAEAEIMPEEAEVPTEAEETEVPEDEEEGNSFAVPEVVPVVYMTSDISPDGLRAVYDALERTPEGNVAVKLSTGEAGNTHYLAPDLIKELVQSVDGTIVECNTAYSGRRISTEMHMEVAAEHGFTEIADVDIMDANGYISLPVSDGITLTENLVGENFINYDFYIVLSHFKGHEIAGYGGALKNISIGIASREGKNFIHSAGTSIYNFGSSAGRQDFMNAMAEAGKSVSDYLGHGERILYINVMNHLSVDCDCDGYPADPDMADIGILASLDPVALDQACIDLVYAAEDGASLIARIESRKGTLVLEHAEEIGLGYRQYELVSVDD